MAQHALKHRAAAHDGYHAGEYDVGRPLARIDLDRHPGRHPAAAERAYARDPTPSVQVFTGQLILGWGMFNLVEGIIDYHILGIHNVREVPNYAVYNLTFLAVGGVLFILIGWLLMRAGSGAGMEARR
jgi:hypothetical protein